MTKPYSPPSFRAPGPLTGQLGNVPAPRSRGSWALAATGLVVAVASAVTGGFALGRHTPTTSPASVTSSTATSSAAQAPDPAAVAAAKSEACTAWAAASSAMVAARQPFLDRTQGAWEWSDPAIVDAFNAAQAGILTEVQYLRQHLVPVTPPAVADEVRDFIAANVDMIAADGQRQRAAVSNDAAGRVNAAADKIRTACGVS